MKTKDIAAILYNYYMENYCETNFSFDNGRTFKEIKKYFDKLHLNEIELEKIESKIKVSYPEGTDYDSMEFRHPDAPDLFLQVTSMIDYDGNKVDGYKGNAQWADVGMFFEDYDDIDFEDIE